MVCSEGGREASRGGGEVPARVPWAGPFSHLHPHSRVCCGHTEPGQGCSPLGMFPKTLRLPPHPPAPRCSAKMAAAVGSCQGGYFSFQTLNVLTPILAHLPAESGGSSSWAQAHVPTRHTGHQHAGGHHCTEGTAEVMNCNS